MEPIYNKLPDIWKNLDLKVTDVVNNKGMLERFLKVPDRAAVRIENNILELLRTHNVQVIQDKFLPLLTDLVGHKWRDDKSKVYNRNIIEVSITKHSYKGTDLRLRDEVRLAGSGSCAIQDNASRLMVVGKQGKIGCTDCVIMDDNFWHDGSFELTVSSTVDRDELALSMAETTAAGELWWVKVIP